MASIICYRSGETEVVSIVPEGTIVLATGKRELLETVLSGVARHAHGRETLLVPGLPEAADNDQAVAAATNFRLMIERSLNALRSTSDLH